MVFYFSGTGNSKYVAEKIGEAIGQEATDVAPYIRSFLGNKEEHVFDKEEVYVFVCPSYMSAPARTMTFFIESSAFPKNIKAYFVVTCAASSGISNRVDMELSAKKGFEYMGTAQVVMPQNYIALFTTKDKEENQKIVDAAQPGIDRIADTIKELGRLDNRKINSLEYAATVGVRDLYYKHFMKTKKFHSTDACIGCGKCVRSCPLGNISIKDGRPSWGGNCTHCMACINQCPKDAIEYGKGSAGKPRYRGPVV